ncbi:carbohydrate ABC transporter permease [Clostridium thermarum]|uniref:carbohydrate ABC transporter permease n=1 Tax=Clostridium thermarum TaxID=1716543 RepID=UPI00111D12FD|nr:carbohydrate ABC transporter permease [Clostridium thermarum]
MEKRKLINKTLVYVFLVLSFIIFVFPFFLMIINSFKSNGEILENPFAMPKTLNFNHFIEVIQKMNFGVTFINSLVITVISTILILLFSAMCAYYLVRKNSKFNKLLFSILVASMIIPFQSIMIPLMYIYGAKLNLIEKVPVHLLIVFYAGFGSALSVFIFHGFIKSIPLELEEAALIDGCGRIRTFFKIVFPILAPTSMTIAILNVMWIWNDYLLPSLILNKRNLYTMPIQMKVFNGTYMNNWELLIPALLLTILPILIVYFIAQKYIIEGVMQGSIK